MKHPKFDLQLVPAARLIPCGFLNYRGEERVIVPGLGFEPKLADSESAVLPLDDPGVPLVSTKNCKNARCGIFFASMRIFL